MLNKPRGCISACSDSRHKTIMDCFPALERDGLFHVGRLDKDTEGLIIVTDDGGLCNHINNPDSLTEKTYRFYAKGQVTEEKLEALRRGVVFNESLGKPSCAARVTLLGAQKMRDIAELLPEEKTKLIHTRKGDHIVSHIELTITEGKKHQVKKMARAVGLYVVYLERVALGGIALDPTLKRGEYRPLTTAELDILRGDF